ncbi:DUF1761 domain-containing protein [Histidinibacterium aquaticum]|uniref:DUF1761 domain-containing protein n=1 Tax=Histidinibacterium aquaticum TaxID=2613962 RepID=A0A5J5GHD0_9RHOB|nr:DUF1761 domain-containing protein [Histidinibacterium aquaticum]KAA9007143.1 DUF1761 domain-containing protein [Histidinibacterium aquaticum]
MGFVSVIAAAAAAFVFGAVWYGFLSKPWMEAASVPSDEKGRPANSSSPVPYVTSAVCILVVTIMMRHTFATSGIETLGAGFVGGLGIGAFFITPWIVLNNGYAMRPPVLSAIDGGYATIGCGLAGLVLVLF